MHRCLLNRHRRPYFFGRAYFTTKNLLFRGDFLQGESSETVGYILYEADLSEEGEDD